MTSCSALVTGEEAVIRQLEEFVQFNEVSQVALVVKNPSAKAGDIETWVRSLGVKIPWRRAWQPTPVFLPGESHGQRSLVGYSP